MMEISSRQDVDDFFHLPNIDMFSPQLDGGLPSGYLTQPWKITILERYTIDKTAIFHGYWYVKQPEGNSPKWGGDIGGIGRDVTEIFRGYFLILSLDKKAIPSSKVTQLWNIPTFHR